MPATSAIGSLTDRLGHLAVWVGFYVAASTVGFSRLAGLPLAWRGVAATSFACAMSVYLVDRVKLRDAWLDPADLQAHPDRFAFLTRRAGVVRLLAAALGIVAIALAATLHPAAPALILASYGGVFLYAGRKITGTSRVKDILLVKNLAVAACIAGFAAMMSIFGALSDGWTPAESTPSDLLLGLVFLGGQVLADAMLCDLDDAESDRRHGTATIPTRFGKGATWAIALAIHALVTALMVLWPAGAGPNGARWRWGLLTLGTTIALRLWPPTKVRDLVDLRLALVAAAALAMA